MNEMVYFKQYMKYQRRDNLKRNHIEISELKSTITEMKNSLKGFKGRSEQAEEEKAVNLKIGQ